MQREQSSEQRELERLRELEALDILDTAPEPGFDRVAQLAKLVAGTPIALVSLVDEHRQWFKSHLGIDTCETPRDIAFCTHAIQQYEIFEVEDATTDPRFRDNPLVTGEPHIRYYCGAPLTTHRGYNMGTLCVIDTQPRKLTEAQKAGLKTLAEQVVHLLETRRQFRILKQAHTATDLQKQLKLMHDCVARLQDIVIITDAFVDGDEGPRILYVNEAFTSHTGYDSQDVIGQTTKILHGEKTQASELRRISTAFQQGLPVRAELVNYKKDGEAYWVECDIAPIRQDDGAITHWVSVERDVTDRKLTEARITSLAYFDTLTRLPNRQRFNDRLDRLVKEQLGPDDWAALLFIDLDDFKNVNDSLGHHVGDTLLQQVSKRLTSMVRGSDLVARLGGDEFVILLDDLGTDERQASDNAQRIARKILQSFDDTFDLDGLDYQVTPSIGIALQQGRDINPSTLLQQADIAMYESKTAGKNAARLFVHDMKREIEQRISLETALRRSIAAQDFCLLYQPQVKDGAIITGYEALLRWHHPEQGILAPGAFIDLAETTGLILPLGQLVLEMACEQIRHWNEVYPEWQGEVSVNVSARQFRHPEFVSDTLEIMKEHAVRPGQLRIELTESLMLQDIDETMSKMVELNRHGVSFSLDDFGTGFSSMYYLKRLPFNELKIDRTFVRDILTDNSDREIVRSMIALGHNLGMTVIAEGVESRAIWRALVDMDCHYYQGYLFGRPCPPEALSFMCNKDGEWEQTQASTADAIKGAGNNFVIRARQRPSMPSTTVGGD